MNLFSGLLNTRVAKAWSRFENFLEVISSFALNSAEEVEEQLIEVGNVQSSFKQDLPVPKSDGQIGLEYFFKTNLLERLLDFILGAKSPLAKKGESRVSMGGTHSQPNLGALMKIVTAMVGAKDLV